MNLDQPPVAAAPAEAEAERAIRDASVRQASHSPSRPRVPLAPSLERRRLQVYLLLLLADAAAILFAFDAVGFLYFGDWHDPAAMLEAQLVLPIYWTFAIGFYAYAADAALKPRVGIWRAAAALVLAMAFVVFVAFYLKAAHDFSRVVTFGGTLAAIGAIAIMRDLLSDFAAWRCGPTGINLLLLHDGGPPLAIPGSHAIDARQCGLRPDIADPHALNRIGMFFRNMDRVVVSCAPERRTAWSLVLKGANIQGEIVDEDIRTLGAVGAVRTPDYAALVISRGPLRLTHRVLKRALDLAIAVPALVVLAPLMVVVAIALKLEDRGPVLFVQRRLGRGNRFFRIYKFRSMRVAASDRDGNVSTARGDSRVTRVGRFIRATSIDELPQLFNVLINDMSLVGPRPHALGSQAGEKLFWQVDDRYWQRHALKPGMTGLAQIRGFRGSTEIERDLLDRLQADLEYLDGWTIWRDVGILARTLQVIVHGRAF